MYCVMLTFNLSMTLGFPQALVEAIYHPTLVNRKKYKTKTKTLLENDENRVSM